jgi:hypothetical protein
LETASSLLFQRATYADNVVNYGWDVS